LRNWSGLSVQSGREIANGYRLGIPLGRPDAWSACRETMVGENAIIGE
jgi:hypothetical protein